MPTFHSHYDNLKVARDATPEQIRTAYRQLTRQHHPDRNPDNADAQRVMSVINVAYDVLSDPVRRLEHDRWIAQLEAASPMRPGRNKPTLHVPEVAQQQRSAWAAEEAAQRRQKQAVVQRRWRAAARHLRRFGAVYGGAVLALAWYFVAGGGSAMPPGLRAIAAESAARAGQPVAGYARAAVAPNGQGWPQASGYVAGYERLNLGGLSEVVIDNSRNEVDVFAKLVSLDGPSPLAVRTVFVAARGRLVLETLSIGTYDLRFRNLASGSFYRTPAFILEEVHTTRGTQHSVATLPLSASPDGSLQSYALTEGEFP